LTPLLEAEVDLVLFGEDWQHLALGQVGDDGLDHEDLAENAVDHEVVVHFGQSLGQDAVHNLVDAFILARLLVGALLLLSALHERVLQFAFGRQSRSLVLRNQPVSFLVVLRDSLPANKGG